MFYWYWTINNVFSAFFMSAANMKKKKRLQSLLLPDIPPTTPHHTTPRPIPQPPTCNHTHTPIHTHTNTHMHTHLTLRPFENYDWGTGLSLSHYPLYRPGIGHVYGHTQPTKILQKHTQDHQLSHCQKKKYCPGFTVACYDEIPCTDLQCRDNLAGMKVWILSDRY